MRFRERLAISATAAWLLVAFLMGEDFENVIQWTLVGWIAVWAGIYGAYWLASAPDSPVRLRR